MGVNPITTKLLASPWAHRFPALPAPFSHR
jgi:hypothetical protein